MARWGRGLAPSRQPRNPTNRGGVILATEMDWAGLPTAVAMVPSRSCALPWWKALRGSLPPLDARFRAVRRAQPFGPGRSPQDALALVSVRIQDPPPISAEGSLVFHLHPKRLSRQKTRPSPGMGTPHEGRRGGARGRDGGSRRQEAHRQTASPGPASQARSESSVRQCHRRL